MLDFIKNNAVLCTGVFSIISALISAVLTLIINRNSERNKTINELKNGLKETKKDLLDAENNLHKSETRLNEYKSIEFAEKT